MSKCRPEAGIEFSAIEEFLRAVHVNGETLSLPHTIGQIHVNPRLTLNMAYAVNTPLFESKASAFDVQDAQQTTQAKLDERIQMLDDRLNQILRQMEPPKS